MVFSLSFNQIFQLLTNITTISTDAKSNSPIAVDSTEFAQCVENISVLNLRLKNSEERCQLLRADLRQAKQVSIELMQSKLHPKLYILSTINTTDYILWHLQLIVCVLAYFDLKKYSSNETLQFFHFHVYQFLLMTPQCKENFVLFYS